MFGDGQQTRDFTYVDDIVRANLSSIENGKAGETYNLGGGSRRKLLDIFPVLEEISQKKVKIRYVPKQKGDVRHTFADIRKAQDDLQFAPETTLEDGLRLEWEWVENIRPEGIL